MAGWKIETTSGVPAQLIAVDRTGIRRPMKRIDGLHYLRHEDVMACMVDVYKKVGVTGKVSKKSLMTYLASLRTNNQ
eukprot:2319545-Amphidinium_carterae.1